MISSENGLTGSSASMHRSRTSHHVRPRRNQRLIIAIVLIALTLSACTSSPTRATNYPPLPTGSGSPVAPSASRPNIVFVLTDDLSWNLIKYMPHVKALEQQGMTFSNYTVTDSLCCPSRASIFSGKFPHSTHVLGNTAPTGGFAKFHKLGEEKSTFATSLYKAGYRTGFMGKYLNEYRPNPKRGTPAYRQGAWVPPGWTAWDAAGNGYPEYQYDITNGHSWLHYGSRRSDYLTSVLQERALRFIRQGAQSPRRPFMLEVATFAPHYPYTPAPQDVGTFPGIRAPHTPAYDQLPHPVPKWLRGLPPISAQDQRDIQHWWQLRVESVQSVDRMIGALEHTIAVTGQAHNTVFVFSSDNGYHLGEYRLRSGKETAFDTDIRVPLVVTGPGIAPGSVNPAMAENIDLRPTFAQLAGGANPPGVEGHSLVPLLHGQNEPWRRYALIEHRYDPHQQADPDKQDVLKSRVPPTYNAIRAQNFVYVRYADGDREYYNTLKDPYELHNLGPSLPKSRVAALDKIMNALIACHSGTQCWTAGVPSIG